MRNEELFRIPSAEFQIETTRLDPNGQAGLVFYSSPTRSFML